MNPLKKLWNKVTYRTEDTTDYARLERQGGLATPAWDNRAVVDGVVEQPQQVVDFGTDWYGR